MNNKQWLDYYDANALSISDEILDEADEMFGYEGTAEDECVDAYYIFCAKLHFKQTELSPVTA